MPEQQPILLALGRGHNGFYCPISRFHLVGVMKPQAIYPSDFPITLDIKRAIRGGVLIDVNKVLSPEDLNFTITKDTPINTSDRKKQQLLDAENAQKEATENGTLKEDGSIPAQQSDLLSETDIDTAEKKDLTDFIKKNDLKLEGINSRSNADDLRTALKLHFGYTKAEEKKAE